MNRGQLSCREVVEHLTDYLEGALPAAERGLFEAHLRACEGCQTYSHQMQLTLRSLRHLSNQGLSGETRAKLRQLFRSQQHPAAARTIRLGMGDEYVAPGDHIAYFWETPQDFTDGVGFLAVGLRAGEHGFVFGHEDANQKVLDALQKMGLDTQELIARGQLHVLGGDNSGEAMLAEIGAAFQAAVDAGAHLLRLLGNLGWGRPGWPVDDDILEFEAQVTAAAQQFPCVIVCMYDVRSLPGRILLKGGFETHPLTVHDLCLRKNPHYIPAELYVSRLRRGVGHGRTQ